MKTRTKLLIALPFAVIALVGVHWLTAPNPDRGPLAPLKRAAGDVHYTKLVISGETAKKGTYDPSIAYSPDGSVGWLSYSAVTGDGNIVGGKISLGQYVSTHLARTTDGGATWRFVSALNESTDGACEMPDGSLIKGAWRYEVSSLVSDPNDPDTTRRWKLFAHKYFWSPKGDRMVPYGWIVMRTAADPAGEWSEEIPLFGAGKNPVAPYHHARVDLNALDPSLKDTVTYTEPGALVDEGRLYLSMTALHPEITFHNIGVGYTTIVLVSDDHGVSWKLAGEPLTVKDANQFGYAYFDGTALAHEGRRVFLLAVPGGSGAWMHDGSVAFEFESLAKGLLKRDANGRVTLVNYFPPQPSILSGPGAGQAAYDEHNTAGGLLFPQFNLKAYPEVFQIYQTGALRLSGKE